jgi:hypothetical protein
MLLDAFLPNEEIPIEFPPASSLPWRVRQTELGYKMECTLGILAPTYFHSPHTSGGTVMNRTILLASTGLLFSTALFAGCERKAALAQYNPQFDSVLPTYYNAAPDTSILEDQRTAFNRMRDANPHVAPAAPAAATGAAPAGAATPSVPPPPG